MTFLITTHGNFELVRDMWLFVANLCSSSTYRNIITAVFILSVTLAAVAGPFSALLGGRLNSMSSWAKGFMIGIFMYYIFLSGNAQVQIYDDVTQQQHTQGNIPIALAMTAGVVNGLTVEIEDLIKTYLTTPVSITDVGFDRGTLMLRESFVGVMKSVLATQIDPQMIFSAQEYARDCVAVKAAREASYKATLERTSDMLTSWAGAAHPALFTYTGLNASGNPLASGANQNVSCQEAWNRMNSYFSSSSSWNNAVNAFCDAMLYDSGDPNSLAACKTDYQNAVKEWVLGGTSKTASDIIKNIFLGKIWNLYLANLGNHEAALAEGYAKASAKSGSMALMLNTWLPTAKTIVFSVMIGLLPLLGILVVTPMGMDAAKFMFGIFVWWGIWCSVDMMMSVMWLNRMNELFSIVSNGGQLGITGLSQLWPLADRALSLMGNMRGFGIMISSAIAYGVFKFGGSAMGHFARAMVGSMEGGTVAASSYMGPEAVAKRQQDLQAVKNTEAYSATLQQASTFGGVGPMTGLMSQAEIARNVAEAHKHAAELDYMGRLALPQRQGMTRATGEMESISRAMSMGGPAGANVVGSMIGTKALANAEAYQNVLNKTKKDHGFTDDLQAASWLSTAEHAKQYGTDAAFWKEYSKMREKGVIDKSFSPMDYAATKSYLSSLPGAGKAFSLRNLSASVGKDPAALELAQESFKMGRDFMTLQTLVNGTGEKDWEKAGKLFGEMAGLSNQFAQTLNMVGGDAEKAKFVSSYEGLQKRMNEFSKFAVNQVVSDYLAGKATDSQLRSVLGAIAKRPEGERLLQKHLNNMEFSSATPMQARHLNRLALHNPNMKNVHVEPGDNVMAAFKYDPNTGELGLAHLRTGQGAEETRGSLRKDIDTEIFNQPRSFWVHGDLLGTGKKGFYHIVGQGKRTGQVIDLDRAFVQTEDGRNMPLPMKLSMTVDPTYENVSHAFANAKDAASPLEITQIDSTLKKDKHDISGGTNVKGSMTTTDMLRDVKMGLSDGASEKLRDRSRQEAQFLFHSKEDLQYSYAMATVNDLAGILQQQHGVSLNGLLDARGSLHARWRSDKQIIGWVAEKVSGSSAAAQASIAMTLQKSAREHTGIDLVKAAVWEIWNSDTLNDQQKAEAITGLIGAVRKEAEETIITGHDDKPQWQRSTMRVMTGTVPGVETGIPKYDPTYEDRVKIIEEIMDRAGVKQSMEKTGFTNPFKEKNNSKEDIK